MDKLKQLVLHSNVTEQVNKYFDKIDNYEIRIKDGNQPRALTSKTKDDKEPQVHIYSN